MRSKAYLHPSLHANCFIRPHYPLYRHTMDSKKEMEREGLLEKEKKGLVLKTLEICRSLGQPRRLPMSPSSKTRTSPKGYLTVCVGIEKERFTIKMECMSHHLFRPLLDHAEMEYGFSAAEGPLEIPCNVDVFLSVLKEMDQEVVEGAKGGSSSSLWMQRFASSNGRCEQAMSGSRIADKGLF